MPRRIAVWVGSDSDLSQCVAGLQVLHRAQEEGKIKFVTQITASIHRNPAELDEILKGLLGKVDVIIAGAGWANHLTANIDARLRNLFGDEKIVVIGVAFEDSESSDHNTAAILSITEVPGTQVVYNDFIGPAGFLEACLFAVNEELSQIKPGRVKPTAIRTLAQALLFAKDKQRKK